MNIKPITIRQLIRAALLTISATSAAAFAQQDSMQTLTRDHCLATEITAAVPANAIGEPVSSVQITTVQWLDTTANAPAHCRIDGQINPVDTSNTARPIHFGVALPDSWNGRAVQLGGGGMNGTVPALAGRNMQSELAQGYITYGSDSGHAMNDPDVWALNDEAIRNLGYAQMKKTHDVAYVLIQRAYARAPQFNYYVGGSQGGREGLTVAQRYPQDYNGVLSSVPIVGFSSLMLGPTRIRIQEKPAANWVPPVKGNAILAEMMRQCDTLDGSVDGVINNYVDCRAIFNVNDKQGPQQPWSKLQCKDNKDLTPNDESAAACLTSAQIDTLHYMFSDLTTGVALPFGRTNFGMWAPTTAIAAKLPSFGNMSPPGGLLMKERYRWQEGAAETAPVFATLGTLGVTGFVMQDVTANPLDFSLEKHGARYAQIAQWLDSTQADFNTFAKQGSKLIITVGTDDTIAPSGEQLNFYQSMLDVMGRQAVDNFARLFVLPQTGHGLTGTSATIDGDGKVNTPAEIPSRLDRFALLTAWVERGVTPALTQEVTGATGTRPLCSYPNYPHLEGTDRAASKSYVCRQPRFAQ
jgi:hypothetical protein